MNELGFYKGNEVDLPSIELRNKTSFYITEDTGKLILGNNTWDSSINKVVKLTSGETDTHYELFLNDKKVFSVPIIKYDVRTNLENCKISEIPRIVKYGDKISCTITNNIGTSLMYSLISIGGCDMTIECFNENNKTININNINGNVYIQLKYGTE